MKKLLLVANSTSEKSVVAMNQLQKKLKGKADVIGCVTDYETDLKEYDADAIVVFGGDGTMLNVSRRRGPYQIPVLGINMGRLGYLAEFSKKDMMPAVNSLLRGRAVISERMMLQVCVFAGKESKILLALNDVVLSSTFMGRTGDVSVSIDKQPLTTLVGDGVIVSTPTGSTAYSLSAGGPIMAPKLRSMVLTPICPHALANRPLVVSDSETITLRATERSGPLRLSVDGQAELFDAEELSVQVCASDFSFLLVQRKNASNYNVLREKLGWGS